MGLQIKSTGKKSNLVISLVAVFALVAQPMYGLVASRVANAVTATANSQSELVAKISDETVDTITLGSNFTISSQVDINRTLTLDGGGYTLSGAAGWNGTGSNDSIIAVTGGNPTISNLTVDGASTGNVQGIQVWQSSAKLSKITAKNNQKAGIHVNGSTVTATDITTSNNSRGKSFLGVASFGGILVSSGTLTIDGQSHHTSEGNQIRKNGGTVVDANSQYDSISAFGVTRYTLKSAPLAPAISSPTEGQDVTTTNGEVTVTWNTVSGAHTYLVSIDGGAAETVSGTSLTKTLAEGAHTVTVQSVAQSGLLGGTSAVRNFTVVIPDTEKPSGSVVYNGGYVAPSGVRYVQKIDNLSFTVNASDNKGVARAIYFAKNVAQPGVEACGNWNADSLTNYNFPTPLQQSVSYTVSGSSIKTCDPSMQWASASRYNFLHAVFDAAGNQSESFNAPNQLVEIDSTQPVIQINSPLAGSAKNGIVPIEVKVTETGSGLKYVNALFTDGPTPEFGHTALTLKTGTTDTYVGQIDTTGKDGKFSLGINVSDNVGNTRSAKAQNITIDNTAPKILTVNLNKTISKDSVNFTSNLFNSGKLGVTITTDETTAFGTQVGFAIPGMAGPPAIGWTPFVATGSDKEYIAQVSLAERMDTSNPSFTPGFLNNKTLQDARLYIRTRDALGNVAYTYYKVDANGNFSYTGTDYKLTIDNEKPTGSVTYSGGNDVSGVRYIKSASDLKYTATLNDAGALDQTSFVVFKLNPDGSRMRNSEGKALFCGNWRNSSSSINLSGTSVVLSDKSVDGCTWSNGGAWGDGLYAIGHIVYDAVGHSASFNTTEQSFVIDKTNPVVSVSPSTTGTLSGTVNFEITVSDTNLDTNQLKKVQVWFSKDNDWNQKKGGIIDLSSGSATFSVNTKDLQDGKYMLNIPAFTDLAGNYQVGGVGPNGKDKLNSYFRWYSIDNTPPVAPYDLSFKISNGGVRSSGGWANLPKGDVTWNHSNPSDVRSYIYYSWTSITGSDWHEGNKWKTPNITSKNLNGVEFNQGEGKYFFCVAAVDALGNESACSDRFEIGYDKTDPIVTIAKPTGPIDTNKKFTIEGTYNDNLSGVGRLHLYVSANGDTLKNPFIVTNLNDAPNNAHAFKYELTQTDLDNIQKELKLADGQELTIKAWAYDKANNWSNTTSTITSDTTAPIAEIKSPATGAFVKTANEMEIELHATDAVGMRWYDVTVWEKDDPRTPGTSPLASWSNEVPASDSTGWTTSFNLANHLANNLTKLDDDEYTIYFTATDLLGRGGEATPVHFTVDSIPPKIEIISATPTLIQGTVGSDATKVWVKIGNTEVPASYTPGSTTWTLAVSPVLAVGTHNITARAVDEAGNTNTADTDPTWATSSVEVDTPITETPVINSPQTTTRTSTANLLANLTPTPFIPADSTDATDTDDNGAVAGARTNNNGDDSENGQVLAAEDAKDSWSLINLLLTIGIGAASIITLLGLLGSNRKDRKLVGRLLTIVPAAGAIIALLLIEDFSGSMIWVNIWSLLIGALAVAQMIILGTSKSSTNE